MTAAYKNLGRFIQALRRAGELKVVDRPVSPFVEISRYTDAESKSPGGGKALLFPRVLGSEFPVATNLFGSSRRIGLALGVRNLDELGRRVRDILETQPPHGLADLTRLLGVALSLTRSFPRKSRAKRPPCQEVVHIGRDVDLGRLPVLHCWPKDAGPFFTLPLVFTKSLITGRRNVGMYRLQVFDRNTTGMHWHIHKDGSHFHQEYRRAGKRMPVAVAVGTDPATMYAATAPLPRNVDELILAGFIRNQPVPLTRCLTQDIDVPAEAEFILEGYVDPDELRREGPFGDHTGYYSLADDYPVFHVTAITHRRRPVYPATLVGRPPMEDCYLAKATERLFLPLLQMVFPEIIDYWLPWEGVFHNIAIVSIRKEFPGHGPKVMHGLWGQGQMSYCKALVIVDDTVDPKDPAAVLGRLLQRFNPETDVVLTKGVLDVLDHSAPQPLFGAKIGLDLTDPWPGEGRAPRPGVSPNRDMESPGRLVSKVREAVPGVVGLRFVNREEKWAGLDPRSMNLCLAAVSSGPDKSGAWFANKLLDLDVLAGVDLMILYDDRIDLADNSLVLWKLFNNVDPERDVTARGGRRVVDARIKGPADGHDREWPDELTFDV